MMDPSEFLFGRIAMSLGYSTAEQVAECIREQEQDRPWDPIGKILCDKGYLNPVQLEEVLATQSNYLRRADERSREKVEDNIFGRLVLKNGFATDDQVNEALREQQNRQADGLIVPIGSILVEKGYMTMEEVTQILEKQWKRILICGSCRRQFNVFGYEDGKEFPCRICGTVLRPAKELKTVHVERD